MLVAWMVVRLAFQWAVLSAALLVVLLADWKVYLSVGDLVEQRVVLMELLV